MNKVFLFFIVIGLIISAFTGRIGLMPEIMLNSSKEAVNTFLNISLMFIFWNAIFNIAIKSNLINKLLFFMRKPVSKLFPYLDTNKTAFEMICSNIIANLLGIGACATSAALLALNEIEKENLKEEEKFKTIKRFIICNVCTITIFPLSIIGIRNSFGIKTNFLFIVVLFIINVFSFVVGLLLDFLSNKICK